jgi:uncharacterized protein
MKCPVCGRALGVDEAAIERGAKLPAFFPFCTERCKLVDLGRWATGKYSIPGDPVDPVDLEADSE